MSIYRTRQSDVSLNSIKNSLADVLPNKAPSLLERSKFEQSQAASVVKAVNSHETPVKAKHLRNILLGTFYDKSTNIFWINAQKLQLSGNPILCWKFCYALHKILREGHPNALPESYKFNRNLADLAKLWRHLKQDYGIMIHNYCNLLSLKLRFHKKNENIPGNLALDDKNLHLITNNDMNNYFQLCCEFFDYIDEILVLQSSVFMSLEKTRTNSMTDSGQCKLSPLVLCILESNQLYDFCVKFLFKLHENLPSDTLEGHRERFLKQFRALKDFYQKCKNLEYFKHLIQIPDLPNSPPNFCARNEFSSYVKPVVFVPEQPEDISIDEDPNDLLIDITANVTESHSNNSSPFTIRDIDLQFYVNEIERLKSELERMRLNYEIEIKGLRDRIRHLENELLNTKSELEQQLIKNKCLEEQIKINAENEKAKEDLESLEKKAVNSEEKFNKMKDLYSKLRDEHVKLLKQDAEVKKQLSSFKETCEHIGKVKKDLEVQLENVTEEKSNIEMSLKLKLNEIEELKSESDKQNGFLIESNKKLDRDIGEFSEMKLKLEQQLNEANKQIEEFNRADKEREFKLNSLQSESDTFKKDLALLQQDNETLKMALEQIRLEREQSQKQHDQTRLSMFDSAIEKSKLLINDSLHKFDDPVLLNCKSGAEYLLTLLNPNLSSLKQIEESFVNYQKDEANAESIVTGKITSLTAADIDKGTDLADLCRNAGEKSIELLNLIKTKNLATFLSASNELQAKFTKIIDIVTELLPKIHDISKEELGDLVEQEMHNTAQAIEDAVAKLALLMNRTREQDTGIKLEVNDKILDACTALMKAIKLLIIKAKDLQKEIAAQGRGTSTVKEFYSKNHKWTEGLVTAAKLVGLGANVLIEKADKLVNGSGKLEEIIVCSNEIAASTAQLVVASNVKASRDSQNLRALVDARHVVSSATANVVASAKSCLQAIEDKNSLDFSNLSLHQTKRMEMESQVKVLELEKQLEIEKRQLYKLRKQHYQLAGVNEGWDAKAQENLEIK